MVFSRRVFMGAAAAASSARPIIGANERIRVAIIGNGHRGVYDMRGFMVRPDCQIAAVCDVYKPRALKAAAIAGEGTEVFTDYRRILERKDVDAVLVATPDHWHEPMMIQACEAGKDVFVEKPLSLTIEGGQNMIAAARKYNRVVQVGLQQRSIEHFKACAQLIQEGLLGRIRHVSIIQPGGYGSATDEPAAPPPDLDWELFQGPAPRRPYTPNRQNRWRGYWDYGGGLITDWGVHWTDVAHWYMNDDMPQTVAAAAQYIRYENPEMVPDVFSISWKYKSYVMNFMNYEPPSTPARFMSGIYFHGERGSLVVNRMGYVATPQRTRSGDAFPAKDYLPPKELIPLNLEAKDHVADFVECIKSRRRPITDVELGFQSTLPTLMALKSVRESKIVAWDGKSAKGV
jgi:predicted dehydrogenase